MVPVPGRYVLYGKYIPYGRSGTVGAVGRYLPTFLIEGGRVWYRRYVN